MDGFLSIVVFFFFVVLFLISTFFIHLDLSFIYLFYEENVGHEAT